MGENAFWSAGGFVAAIPRAATGQNWKQACIAYSIIKRWIGAIALYFVVASTSYRSSHLSHRTWMQHQAAQGLFFFFFLIMWHFLSPHPHPSRLRWTPANHFVYQGCRDNRRNVPHLELTLGDFSALVVNYSSVWAFLCIFNPYTYINIYKIIHSIITMILTVEHFMYHALVLLIFRFLSWFVCFYMDLCFKLSTHCEALKLVSLSIEVASKNKTKKKTSFIVFTPLRFMFLQIERHFLTLYDSMFGHITHQSLVILD